MRVYKAIPSEVSSDITKSIGQKDVESVKILRKFHGSVLQTCSPRMVTGDGNCMYRAASLAVYGTQQHHLYLRPITAMELIQHTDVYDMASSTRLPALFSNPVSASPCRKLIEDACKPNAFSELAHIYALSAALGTPIQSYMPASGAVCFANPYTCLVVGRGVRGAAAAMFTLMWTMMSEPKHAVDFRPDHFSLLITRSGNMTDTVEIEHDEDKRISCNETSVSTEDCHEEQGCNRGDTTDNNIEADMMQDDALGCHVADEDSQGAPANDDTSTAPNDQYTCQGQTA